MNLKKVSCPICGKGKKYSVLYKKNFKFSHLNHLTFSARRLPDKVHYRIVKCKGCGLVRSNPVINPSKLSKLYQKSTLTYGSEIKSLQHTYLKAIFPVLKKLTKKSKILEIGCGNGFLLDSLYKKGYKNVFGLEPSVDAISKSKSYLKKNLKNDILKPNLYPNNSFDFVFFFQTFDHIPNPNQFLKVCHNILKPNGYILSFNHDVESFSSKLLKEKSPIIDIEHTFLYTQNTIKKIFSQNGYKVSKIYSPYNTLSLQHLFWLFPIPNQIKKIIANSKFSFLKRKISLQLGNLCIIANKK